METNQGLSSTKLQPPDTLTSSVLNPQDYPSGLKNLFKKYLQNIAAFVIHQTSDESLMRSVEDKIKISPERIEDFRQELHTYAQYMNQEEKEFSVESNPIFKKALEEVLNQEPSEISQNLPIDDTEVEIPTSENLNQDFEIAYRTNCPKCFSYFMVCWMDEDTNPELPQHCPYCGFFPFILNPEGLLEGTLPEAEPKGNLPAEV